MSKPETSMCEMYVIPPRLRQKSNPFPTTSNRRAETSLGKRTESENALTTAAPPRPAWMRTFFEPPTLLL